jgi:ribose 1,5-bisphosphokinase
MSQLFYIIGASGVGKDSLMNYARQQINGTSRVIFAPRYITRAAKEGNENHIYISPEEFRSRAEDGLFALAWESHGQYYGIGMEIENWLEKGYRVIVNGSRQYLPEAKRKYSHLQIIIVEASPATILKRLTSRGRESRADIQKRMQRTEEIPQVLEQQLIYLQNDGPLEKAGAELVNILCS